MHEGMAVDSIGESLVTELQRKLGRNLLRFQEIEFSLKFMMPYIHPTAHANGLDSFKAMREELADKPLGMVIERFRESVWTDAPDILFQELDRVLAARNELVHHFFQLPGIDFLTLEGVRKAIHYLDEQFRSVETLHGIVRSQSAAVLLGILKSSGNQNSDISQHRDALLKAVGPDAEIINDSDPTKTVWETTRIVQLLRLAETETEPFEGMTLLARAGSFIRRSAPDLSPRLYGLKRLTDVLLASGLFDVEFRANDDQGSVTVLYRSLAEPTETTRASVS